MNIPSPLSSNYESPFNFEEHSTHSALAVITNPVTTTSASLPKKTSQAESRLESLCELEGLISIITSFFKSKELFPWKRINSSKVWSNIILQMTTLNLAQSKITDSCLQALSSSRALKNLNLRWCSKLTNEGFSAVESLTALQRLDLSANLQYDGNTTGLSNLTALQSLKISHNNIFYVNGLSGLSNLRVLHHLDLSYPNINKIKTFLHVTDKN